MLNDASVASCREFMPFIGSTKALSVEAKNECFQMAAR
jgi:hypothetical protein